MAAASGWLCLLLFKVRYLRQGGHQVDDSYMFLRYALHMRHGLGMSWNLDGVPTYGMTTLLWTWFVVPFSMLPLPGAESLSLASWTASGLAMIAMAAAVWTNATSDWLRDKTLTLGFVALSVMLVPMFDYASASGMETALGCALVAALLGLVLLQGKRTVAPEWIGVVGWLLYLTRPEGLIPAILLIMLAWWLVPGVTARRMLRALLILAAAVALTSLAAKLYFGTALPLPFYLKARHGYTGYRQRWYPFTYALTAMQMCLPYTILIALFANRRTWRLLVLAAVPLLAVAAYLCTVTQIMGFHDRYYVPYLPLVAIPAFLVLDDWLTARSNGIARSPGWSNAVAFAAVVAFTLGAFPRAVIVAIERHTDRNVRSYADVIYTQPTVPAPSTDYFANVQMFADDVVRYMPAGSTIAASEVGYLGFAEPTMNILDMAGLNDRQIALHGFDVGAFLARRPDVIWLPHSDYSYQRGVLLSDPRFLQEYDLYAGAFNYGLAVRKDSPAAAIVRARLAVLWPRLYPGTTPQQSLVQHLEWPSGSTVPPVDPPPYNHRPS